MSVPEGAMPMVDGEAETLAEAGLLTERQARVYILRDVLALRRGEVADVLDVSASAVDGHRAAARDKIEAARETVERIDALGGFDPEGEESP
jgi:DNA-directed RNA polymerase specialized sigma24 family protein